MVFKIMTMTMWLVVLAPTPCSAEFRDPTQPAYQLPSATGTDANGAEGNSELVLSAIWISSHSKRATINNINAKEGQTIVIDQTPVLKPVLAASANTVTTGDKKKELLNKAMELTNAKTNNPTQEHILSSLGNMAGPLGGMIAPLLTSAIGSMDIPQLQGQSAASAETGIQQQTGTTQHTKAPHIPTPRSITIKIISIHKNSVTIDQNGELKTLQLVQRPYKTARNKYQVHL
ncbi:MAG TPA: hypothetical protein VIF37_04790 [Methylobacter sp.]